MLKGASKCWAVLMEKEREGNNKKNISKANKTSSFTKKINK
jgi:hypothetical protein